MSKLQVGQRVKIPDPLRLNPMSGLSRKQAGAFGPGVVERIDPPRFDGGHRRITVKLDSGETRTVGEPFASPE